MALTNLLDDGRLQAFRSEFVDNMLAGPGQWNQVCPLYTDEGYTIDVKDWVAGGPFATFASTTSSITPEPLVSAKKQHTQVFKALKHTVTWGDFEHFNDVDWTRCAASLARKADLALDGIVFTGLEALQSTNHPKYGTTDSSYVGNKYCLDTGLAYLYGVSGAGTQDSKLSLGFSADAYDSALQLLRKWKDVRGDYVRADFGEKVIVVDPSNERIAKQVVGSGQVGLDLSVNPLQGSASVVSYPLADTGDWYVVNKSLEPIALWMPEPPNVLVARTTDGLWVDFVVKFTASFIYKPYLTGLVMSEG